MVKNDRLPKLWTLIISTILMVSLTGCGRKPEETVKLYFNSLQKQDIKTATSCLYNSKPVSFQNADQEKLVKLIFSRLEYETESETINNYTAKVKTKITSIDLAKVMSSMVSKLLPKILASSQNNNDTSSMVYQYLSDNIKDSNAPTITSEIDINLIKDANTKKWVIVSDEDLTNAMTGNFIKALSSYNQSVK